jgi:hypothetical protein
MSTTLKCPNPSCPYPFDPTRIPPGAVITCPRCGMRFTLGQPAPGQAGSPVGPTAPGRLPTTAAISQGGPSAYPPPGYPPPTLPHFPTHRHLDRLRFLNCGSEPQYPSWSRSGQASAGDPVDHTSTCRVWASPDGRVGDCRGRSSRGGCGHDLLPVEPEAKRCEQRGTVEVYCEKCVVRPPNRTLGTRRRDQ